MTPCSLARLLLGLGFALGLAMLDDGLRRGYWTCSRSGVPWLQGTINGFAGQRCSASWPGLDKRAATFNGLVRR